jgi:hypothetical protein
VHPYLLMVRSVRYACEGTADCLLPVELTDGCRTSGKSPASLLMAALQGVGLDCCPSSSSAPLHKCDATGS